MILVTCGKNYPVEHNNLMMEIFDELGQTLMNYSYCMLTYVQKDFEIFG